MNIVVMIGALGMMLGPVVGGVITKQLSWHWIFWVNGPIGFLAIILAYFLLPSMPARLVYSLDKIGFLLFGSGLASLTFGFSIISETDILWVNSLLTIGLSVLLLVLYTAHSFHKPHPIVKVQLFAIRTFRISVLGNLFCRIGFGGMPFVLPLLLQIGLGFSPQLSGLLIAPMALGVLIVKPLSIHILRLLGYKNLLFLNTFLLGVLLCTFSLVDQYSSLFNIGVMTCLYGFLMSLQYTGMNTLAYATIEPDDISSATSIMSTIQQLSQSFGVTVAAFIISFYANTSVTHALLTMAIFHQTFVILGLLTLASMVLFFQLKKEDGQELITVGQVLK